MVLMIDHIHGLDFAGISYYGQFERRKEGRKKGDENEEGKEVKKRLIRRKEGT